jgi:hypothetical protein
MIRLACPSCSKKLAVEDSSAGSVCKCPACANKFRVPEGQASPPAPAAPTQPAAPKKASVRDSAGRSSAARRARSQTQANGEVLDQLELVDDDVEVRPRRNAKKGKRQQPQPPWVYVVAGIPLCGLAVAAIFFKYLAIGLIAIGLPASLLSRKWKLIGTVGVAYLLTGAGFYMLHRTLWALPEGPPPKGASAQVVDAYCAKLLKDPDKIDAGSWVGVGKPTDSSLIRALRVLIKDAYNAGAPEVWLTNVQKVDPTGLPSPDLVVALPSDEVALKRVLAWYRVVSTGKQPIAPGEKYLYVAWD